jgi:hypothetical protein
MCIANVQQPPPVPVPGTTTTTTVTPSPDGSAETTIHREADRKGNKVIEKDVYREGIADTTETHTKTEIDRDGGTSTTRAITTKPRSRRLLIGSFLELAFVSAVGRTDTSADWSEEPASEERTRYYATALAHSMGITLYVVRCRQGRFLTVQTPSDDCEVLVTVTPTDDVSEAA